MGRLPVPRMARDRGPGGQSVPPCCAVPCQGQVLPWCVTGLYKGRRPRTKHIVPPSTKHAKKNSALLAPWPQHYYLSKLEGGGSHTRTRPGCPPPPPVSHPAAGAPRVATTVTAGHFVSPARDPTPFERLPSHAERDPSPSAPQQWGCILKESHYPLLRMLPSN